MNVKYKNNKVETNINIHENFNVKYEIIHFKKYK